LDCRKGEELASQYLAWLAKHPTNGNVVTLGWIVPEMADRLKAGEPWTGVIVGFLARLADAAILGAVVE
jgi:hypothetical protein